MKKKKISNDEKEKLKQYIENTDYSCIFATDHECGYIGNMEQILVNFGYIVYGLSCNFSKELLIEVFKYALEQEKSTKKPKSDKLFNFLKAVKNK